MIASNAFYLNQKKYIRSMISKNRNCPMIRNIFRTNRALPRTAWEAKKRVCFKLRESWNYQKKSFNLYRPWYRFIHLLARTGHMPKRIQVVMGAHNGQTYGALSEFQDDFCESSLITVTTGFVGLRSIRYIGILINSEINFYRHQRLVQQSDRRDGKELKASVSLLKIFVFFTLR